MKALKPLLPVFLLSLLLSDCIVTKVRSPDDSGWTVPSPLPEGVADSSFSARAKDEMADLRLNLQGMDRAVRFAQANPALFKTPANSVLLPAAKDSLFMIWEPFLDYLYAAEAVRIRHSSFWKIPYLSRKNPHAQSFALTYTALLGMYYYGSRFIALMDSSPQQEVILNEARGDVPAESYARLKYQVLNIVTWSQIYWGHQHFQDWCRAPLAESGDSLFAWANTFVESYSDSAAALARSRNFKLTEQNGMDLTRRQVFMLWFPAQKNLAAWMGGSQYRPDKRPALIGPSLIDSLRRVLEPGDILYERSNWFVSNIGLPGFWPHAEFHAGSFPEMDAFFNPDTATSRLVRSRSDGRCSTLTGYIGMKWPEKAALYLAPKEGEPLRVIEARSEGVIFSTLSEACHADYIGAVRPLLSKAEKAAAILQAFEYHGLPYDFDFDFASDASLVCTELVTKAYQKRPGSRGLSFDLVEILGRLTLPPNDMVAQFDREWAAPAQQTAFVAFIDASEKEGRAFFSTAEAFRKSHLRPKWDFLLE